LDPLLFHKGTLGLITADLQLRTIAMLRARGLALRHGYATLRCSTFGLLRATSLLLLNVAFRVLVELTLTILRAESILAALIIYFCCRRFLIDLPSAYWIFGHFDGPPARNASNHGAAGM
jgi:hypothetical protein